MSNTKIETPTGLTPQGRGFWTRLKNSVDKLGNLDPSDAHILYLAARTFEELELARSEVMKKGISIEVNSDRGAKIIKTNPAAAVMNQASSRLLRCLNQLGLTPAARGRGGGGGGANLGDPIGDLIGE